MSSRRAMVTGASSGIGEAFVRRLAAEGWATTLVARTRERLEAVKDTLPGHGHEVFVADLADETSLSRVAADVGLGPYDLLVNDAGFGLYGRFDRIPIERAREMMRVNCDAVVRLSHAFLRQAGAGATLVNVASALGLVAYPQAALYAASKAFVLALGEALWWEERERDVYVLTIAPGVTRTRFHQRAGGHAGAHPAELLSQGVERVVDEGMRAIAARRQPVLVTGLHNRVLTWGARFVGRRTRLGILGRFPPVR